MGSNSLAPLFLCPSHHVMSPSPHVMSYVSFSLALHVSLSFSLPFPLSLSRSPSISLSFSFSLSPLLSVTPTLLVKMRLESRSFCKRALLKRRYSAKETYNFNFLRLCHPLIRLLSLSRVHASARRTANRNLSFALMFSLSPYHSFPLRSRFSLVLLRTRVLSFALLLSPRS